MTGVESFLVLLPSITQLAFVSESGGGLAQQQCSPCEDAHLVLASLSSKETPPLLL